MFILQVIECPINKGVLNVVEQSQIKEVEGSLSEGHSVFDTGHSPNGADKGSYLWVENASFGHEAKILVDYRWRFQIIQKDAAAII